MYSFWQGGTQPVAKKAISKVTHSIMQLQSKLAKCYTGSNAKTTKIKTPKTNCKLLSNLKHCNFIN